MYTRYKYSILTIKVLLQVLLLVSKLLLLLLVYGNRDEIYYKFEITLPLLNLMQFNGL